MPGEASLLHALGLQRVREKRTAEALALLKRALERTQGLLRELSGK